MENVNGAGTDSALAASHATADIPIVFSFAVDPVQRRLVDSLARPGGNATGVTALDLGSFLDKELDLLQELLPTARRVAYSQWKKFKHALYLEGSTTCRRAARNAN